MFVHPYTNSLNGLAQMPDMHSFNHHPDRVAEGAGISPATLRGYYARGKFRQLGGEKKVREPASKGGEQHRYNVRGAMHIALAVELIRYGVDGAEAFDAALTLLVGDDDRVPGGTYPPEFGSTVFVYSKSATPAFRWLGHDEDLAYIRPQLQRLPSYLTIDLNLLEQRVFAALGVEGHSWDKAA